MIDGKVYMLCCIIGGLLAYNAYLPPSEKVHEHWIASNQHLEEPVKKVVKVKKKKPVIGGEKHSYAWNEKYFPPNTSIQRHRDRYNNSSKLLVKYDNNWYMKEDNFGNLVAHNQAKNKTVMLQRNIYKER